MECERGETIAEVLDEGMSTRDDVRADGLLEAAHGPQPLLQMPMIPLQAIVEVPGAAMCTYRQNVAEDRGIALCLVGRHPRGAHTGLGDGPLKEGSCRLRIAPRAEVDIDDLTILSIAR